MHICRLVLKLAEAAVVYVLTSPLGLITLVFFSISCTSTYSVNNHPARLSRAWHCLAVAQRASKMQHIPGACVAAE
jgi:hypothetical protein